MTPPIMEPLHAQWGHSGELCSVGEGTLVKPSIIANNSYEKNGAVVIFRKKCAKKLNNTSIARTGSASNMLRGSSP